MGVLILFLTIAYTIGILACFLLLNWLTATYLDPQINIYLWWSVIIYSIIPIVSFFLKRYFRKNMRKVSWKLKGIAWMILGLCFINWIIGLLIINYTEIGNATTTVLDTKSVIVIGAHLFFMILFYRLSDRIK
ncbi:MAG: hypothetical protein ACPGJS_15350 [Flammeovirgaceae bacterium]